MENPTDQQLVQEVLNGNKDAFGILVSNYEDKLTRYARRFISDENEVSDILQNVFIKAYVNLNGFNFNFKFSSWIYRIMHNEIVNYIKHKQKRKIIFNIDWDTILPINLERDSLANEIDKEEVELKLKTNLNNLPYKYKEVLTLHYLQELSYKEISDILHKPVSTIGVRIKRAKELIKKQYLNKK